MTERDAFVGLALQLRRQRHQQLGFARQAIAAGRTDEADTHAARASRYLADARWYLAKAMDRPLIINPEN